MNEINQEKIEYNNNNESKKRLIVVSVILALITLIVIIRLFFLTIISTGEAQSRLTIPSTPTLRGIIYDRNNNRLAISVERFSIAIRPKNIKADIENFKKNYLIPLSKITERTGDQIVEIIDKYYEENLVYLVRKIKLSEDDIKILQAMKGVILLREFDRRYPQKNVGSHIIGITGRDDKGLEGIEFHFDEILREKGNAVGLNLVLSIDRDIQSTVEQNIKSTVLQEDANSASAIIMNAENGDIVAMSNYPDYNLQDYRNMTREDFLKKSRNLSVSSSDEIGSSFKAFIIAMLSELNLIDLEKLYDCKGFYKVDGGQIIRDTAAFGKLKFPDVVKVSSNVGMIEAAMTIPKQKYYNFLKLLGFMEKTGIDLPYENSRMFRSYEMFRNQSRASVAIGQEIGLTPIQIVTAAASLINGGYLIKPRIVIETRRGDSTVNSFDVVKKRKILSEKTNKKVWELLSKVLESGGTGFGANITINNKRLLIAGKTGTAQVYDKKIGRYSDSLRNASFLGFLKRPRNNYVIYIIVRQPKRDPEHSTGSTIAVPLFKNIVTQILDKFGSRLP